MARLSTGNLASLFTMMLVGCESPTRPLLDLPDLRVVTPPASRGSPVVLEVVNSTAGVIRFDGLACRVSLEELRVGEWRPVESDDGECTGILLELPPNARHPVSVDTPVDRGARYRGLAEGSSADGPFVIRSPPFDVE